MKKNATILENEINQLQIELDNVEKEIVSCGPKRDSKLNISSKIGVNLPPLKIESPKIMKYYQEGFNNRSIDEYTQDKFKSKNGSSIKINFRKPSKINLTKLEKRVPSATNFKSNSKR